MRRIVPYCGRWSLLIWLLVWGLGLILCWSSSAWATEKLFSWEGERGYGLDCVMVVPGSPPEYKFIFTAPDRQVLGIYYSSDPNPYFQLHLEGDHHRPWGEIDVGGQNQGELFLKGTIGEPLQLIKILGSQEEIVLDQGKLFYPQGAS